MSEYGAGKNGFTRAQLEVLRHQIVVYKKLKTYRNGEAVEPSDLAAAVPPPLKRVGAPQSTQAADQGASSPAADASRGETALDHQQSMQLSNGTVMHSAEQKESQMLASLRGDEKQADGAAHPSSKEVDSKEQEVDNGQATAEHPLFLHAQLKGPLYAVSEGPAQQPTSKSAAVAAHLPSIPFQRATVLPLLQMELHSLARRGLDSLRWQCERALDPRSHSRPGFAWGTDGSMPRGAALLVHKALNLLERQRALRAAVETAQLEISAMAPAKYKSMSRAHRTQRIETARRELALRAEIAARRARDAKQAKSDSLATHWAALRDGLAARNKGVMTAHSRLTRERNKARLDERTMRMEAIKAHDFEAYQELLRSQAVGAADQKYEAISRFLRETEEYLIKLAGKIAGVKLSAEVSKATADAIVAARAKGLSEEEVQAAAKLAAQDAAAANVAARMDGATGTATDARSQYYSLAHSNRESIAEQPSLLRPPNGAKLREYQLVGLQWMVSLYNNHLNGILADEMGLGKTVQVMALIAYLMEHKSNFGPHLIIVPNAVLVNWKAELTQWLPSARCVYYVGSKEERIRKYTYEVQSLQFNILVTTYEFIMRDTTRLAKIDWQYIVIDEAQRMKDRESKLAKDLDRFTASRRLLLSGTPLQNDLLELWSLLNLLLPEVFDDRKMFAEWFGGGGAGGAGGGGEADWLEKERRVVVIHRLHQILEPFMLRRQVEDVETKLPPKTTVVVRVPMAPYQAAIYDWVKATGTIRLDPEGPQAGRHHRVYHTLTNKCMELRKLCNHPLLTYPPPDWGVGDAIVRQCGKLLVLDRILIKLIATGHRVLLFSTMTRLLDLLEVYLRWRTVPEAARKALDERKAGTASEDTSSSSIVRQEGPDAIGYLRIDGTTSLDDREAAIRAFNAPGSRANVFLLSIRAAGRGLNLQSADTVVIYDPDPNPKNEEQAIARSHRIGQTKEVRVIHLESVANPIPGQCFGRQASEPLLLRGRSSSGNNKEGTEDGGPQQQQRDDVGTSNNNIVATPSSKEDDAEKMKSPPSIHSALPAQQKLSSNPPPARRLYADSIESLVRNQIQRVKIDMANEVIDAGRFDQQTSNDERRQTLEALLQDESRTSAAQNTVLSWAELNEQLARGGEEHVLFDTLDTEVDWMNAFGPDQMPAWMRWTAEELAAAAQKTAAERSRRPPDLAAEMAALTGIVTHPHHIATSQISVEQTAARPRRISIKLPRTVSEVEVSTGQDEEVVAAMEGDTEEEDVELGADIVDDDVTTTQTGAASLGTKRATPEDLRHVESTAHFNPASAKKPRTNP